MNPVRRAKMLLIELESLKETTSLIGQVNLLKEVLRDAEQLAKDVAEEEEIKEAV